MTSVPETACLCSTASVLARNSMAQQRVRLPSGLSWATRTASTGTIAFDGEHSRPGAGQRDRFATHSAVLPWADGRLHRPDDAQVEPSEVAVGRLAVASAGLLTTGSPRKQPPASRPADCPFRTIWAAPHLRAARALWSESGGRGGVSDLGGGEQPTAEASAASRRRGRARPGRGMSPFALAGPAMPDGTRAIEGHLRPHARACVRRPSARKMCLARAGSAPVARSQESRWSTGSTR